MKLMKLVSCKRLLLALLSSALFTLPAADYKILLAPDANPMEKTAAKEMQFFAGKILGKEIPIVSKVDGKAQYIRIGATADAAKTLNADFSKFADDELIIKTVKGDLYLAGGKARGTLYAVYEYLERFCGVRFLTPTENHIPALKELPAADFRYAPKIKVRVISHRKRNYEENIFLARRRLNGTYNHMLPLDAEFGGSEHVMGCHTFQKFVPATPKGLKENPEFYSMIKGKRVHNGQICMTNKKLRAHVIAGVKKWLKENPAATRVSVSMNDYNRFCECPECTNWLKERDAIISDLLLDFVNEVAAGVEEEYPDVEVVTLAYLAARKPPKVVKPRKNVGILYCFIELDTSKPLTAKGNSWMLEEVASWQKTGAKIYTWFYTINQKLSFLTQPNWEAVNEDLRLMAERNAEFVFCEFSYPEHYTTDLIRLRFYVMSALLWNQEKSLDEIIADFCVPYYGAAAPDMMKALQIIRKAPVENQGLMVCNFASSVIRAYGHEKYLAAWQKMQDARKAAEKSGDKIIQNRVELAVIPYDMTLLHDCFDLRNGALKELDAAALYDRDVKILKANGITHYFGPKTFTLDNYREKLIRLWGHNDGEVPEGIEKVPGTIIWEADKICNQNRNRRITVVDDPEASGGKAMQIIANGKRLARLEFDNALRGKYRIYLTVKVEVQGKSKGVLMTGNVWESSTRWKLRAKPMKVKLPETPGKGYEVYLMGEAEFKGSYDLQIPQSDDPAIKNAWIDRVIMVPVK